jgi:hypothetical protein
MTPPWATVMVLALMTSQPVLVVEPAVYGLTRSVPVEVTVSSS